MKKLITFLAVLAVIGFTGLAWAGAGTCTQSVTEYSDYKSKALFPVKTLTFSCTGMTTTTTATISDTATVSTTVLTPYNLSKIMGMYLYKVETVPTATPQDNYDIFIYDANGIDLAGGLLNNRSTSAVQQVLIQPSTGFPVVTGPWTLSVQNNNVDTSTVTVIMTFVR